MIENKYDWNIHKRLDEAKRVYICPARGNGKLYNQIELYLELTTRNKDIKLIRAEDIKKAVDKIKSEPVLDYDLYSDLAAPMYRDSIDRFLDEEMRKYLCYSRTDWKPKVIFDTTIADTDFWKEWMLRHSVYGGFIIAPTRLEDDA